MANTVIINDKAQLREIEIKSKRANWWKKHKRLKFILILLFIAAVLYIGAVLASFILTHTWDFTPEINVLREVFR